MRDQPGLQGALAKSRKSPLGRGATSTSRRRRPASQRRRNSWTGLGRWPEQEGASDAAQDAVEFEVGLLAGEGAAAGTPAAVDAAGVAVPGVALGLGEAGEPVFGEGAEELAHVELGRGAGVAGDDVGAAIEGATANGGVVQDEGEALAELAAEDAAGEAGIAGVMEDHGSLLRGGSNLSVYCVTWGKIWNEELKLSSAKYGLVIGD